MTPSRTISATQVAQARNESSAQSPLKSLQEGSGLLGANFVKAIAAPLGLHTVNLPEAQGWNARFDLLSFADAHRMQCALADHVGQVCLVLADPLSLHWPRLRRQFPNAVPHVMDAGEFAQWLQRLEGVLTALPNLSSNADIDDAQVSSGGEVISLQSLGSTSAPAIHAVNSTLYDALKAGASDIHLECEPGGMAIKLRLDGVLAPIGRLNDPLLAEQVISRIKVMAELDIAERRVPQDGRLQVVRQGRPIDVRVSIMPSIHGEDAVLRLLDRQTLASQLSGLSLSSLGFDGPTGERIVRLARRPHGMLLVTGPTGSGKTTTLYAALSDTHDPRHKTITIEDPVEYQLPGVLQIPVNEKKGLDFARGLRSILRHDPDRILVGEIRDAETAHIAVQSSLTGHLVFTTVHANGVLDVYGRFAQFGIDAYSLASSLNGILAQRLVRRLCGACSVHDEAGDAVTWRKAMGCADCRGTGYRGRFAIGELLIVDANIRNLIAERASPSRLEEASVAAGLIPLRQRVMDAVSQGITSLEEADRVTAH